MHFIQSIIHQLFSSSDTNVSGILNSAYTKNQHSKKQFFASNVETPKLLSIEDLAKYFNLPTEDIIEILLTLPSPWIEKTVRGYLPTKEGNKQGAREAYDNYASSTLWNESILFNETLISKINIKINTDIYQTPSTLERTMHYPYSMPA
ncbi:MAG TPA: hypothetical protein EYG82_00530 [Sulfurovum sp.]|nr:hypothetical protein [Sulfurovum sp.]